MASKRTSYLPSTPSVQIEGFPSDDLLRNSSIPRTSLENGFFTNDSKIDVVPPSPTRSRLLGFSSSVTIPLLHGANDDDDRPSSIDVDPERRTSRPRSLANAWALLYHSRLRLHPIALLPACLLGILLAFSGMFGSVAPRPLSIAGYSLTQAHGQPAYIVHESGHLFLHPSSLDPSSDTSPASPRLPRLGPVHHPIHDLIANATAQWKKKLARQSKTLEEAVAEYKRRYGRKPPKGFDHWFKFAQSNEVVLIDEFDNIARDTLPFWAIPPRVLHERARVLEDAPWTFTMVIKKGAVSIAGAHQGDGRAADQAKLMQRWVKWVPHTNITMSAHDGPSIMTDERMMRRHVEAAKAGVLLPEDELDEIDEDASYWGFPLACAEDSRLRRAYNGLETGTLPLGPSYVQDHLKTMDMCENPEWQYLHGFTAWPGMRPRVIQPLFSFAKMSLHSDILLTPLEQYWDTEPWDPEWDAKPNNKAVWRGSTTGVWFDRTTWWRSSQRVRLYFMSKDKKGSKNVRLDGLGKKSGAVPSIVERSVKTDVLMDRYVDFAFSGKAGQCDEDDGSCDAVKRIIDFQPIIGWNQANEYKYLLDLDGNAWSGRFHRLLSSNSAVIKSTIFPEWYSDWIQPWVHYIPVKVDYTDLFDVMAFFSGDLEGNNAHDALAKAIADQGKEYTAKHWRYQDMEAYFFRLALEWARLTSSKRETMDYTGPGA